MCLLIRKYRLKMVLSRLKRSVNKKDNGAYPLIKKRGVRFEHLFLN